MKEKILVVDDEKEITDLVALYLENEGFQVYKFYDSREALECARREEMDLAVLDIMMPEVDGLELCRLIRQKYTYPIIMLTAKGTEIDKINGLTLGADDYVTKPFSIKILLKKISVFLSREPKNFHIYDDGFLRIDFELGKVQKGKEECPVTPTEYRILKKLIQNKGQLLTYSLLLDSLWDEGVQLLDKHALAVNINRLRKKIETEEHSYISNVYGMGYIWK